ncbi:BhlA/UviB family holin-like peptide [Brevibacillus borstelensis]|uniref:BhlA/UviB family holin-like peptide n=1 Tax=Brevibacillus borstelensis TaxID=45462 RepID=UPI000568D960
MDVLKYFLTQGPFALLFVWLLLYTMKRNERRENRLQDILDKFSEKYDVVISELREIKGEIKDKVAK